MKFFFLRKRKKLYFFKAERKKRSSCPALVKLTQQFLKFFGYGKLLSLGFIIIGGLVMNFTGRVAQADVFTFSQMFQFDENNSIVYPELSIVGIALYQGLWAYDGWNQLNYISGELKNPANLPRAIMVAMFSVTCLYLLTNYAYLSQGWEMM